MSSDPHVYWLEHRLGPPDEGSFVLWGSDLPEPPPPWLVERWLGRKRLLWLQGHDWSGIGGAVDEVVRRARRDGRRVRIFTEADLQPGSGIEPGALLLVRVSPQVDTVPREVLRVLAADPEATALLVGPPTRAVSLPDELDGAVLSPAPVKREDVRGLEALLEQPGDFVCAIPWGRTLLSSLEKEGFELRALHSVHRERMWVLRVGVPSSILSEFGLAEEVLVLAVRDEIRHADIESGRRELLRNGVQVEPELVIAVDGAPDLTGRLTRLRGAGVWVPWPIGAGQGPSLREQLDAYLPTYDLFDQHLPVRLADVYGRQSEIADFSARILRGESLGVFGLRKVGKTTAVRAVTDRLDPTTAPEGVGPEGTDVRALVAWVDAQGVRREHARGFLSQLVRKLAERARRAGVAVEDPDPTPEALERMLEIMIVGSGLPVCIVIDECDFLFVGDSGRGPIPGITTVLGMLRAISQTRGKLSVVLIGRDPTVTQSPLLEGLPNPFLSWFSVRWLGSLQREVADDLLVHLGARVGLEVSESTRQLAWRWTGGHAFLHRQFGSALWQVAGGQRRVDTTPLELRAVERFEERTEVESAATEILSLLERHFPAAYDVLLALVGEGVRTEVLDRYGGLRGPGPLLLQRLGLLERSGDALSIPELVATRARWMAPPRRVGTA